MPTMQEIMRKAEAHKSKALTEVVTKHVLSNLEADEIISVKGGHLKVTEFLEQIDIQTVIEKASLDPRKRYCRKTGKEIGTINESELQLAIKLHGIDEVEKLVDYIQVTNDNAPAWLDTSPEKLSVLMRADPCGFFVYASSHALIALHRGQNSQSGWHPRKGWADKKEELKFQHSKILAYQMLEKINQTQPELIAQVNRAWKQFLSLIDRTRLRLPLKYVHEFCTVENLEYLHRELYATIINLLAQEKYSQQAFEFLTKQAIADKYGGSSVFRLIDSDIPSPDEIEIDKLFETFGLTKDMLEHPQLKRHTQKVNIAVAQYELKNRKGAENKRMSMAHLNKLNGF